MKTETQEVINFFLWKFLKAMVYMVFGGIVIAFVAFIAMSVLGLFLAAFMGSVN